MQACVIFSAGDLRVVEKPEPRPGPGQVAVGVAVGGICGSDLHYFHDGAVGDFRVVAPMVLGHEVVGHVVAHGEGVTWPPVGAPVAVDPATTCGRCDECRSGRRNLCADSRYLGSAARVPHVQGGFSERIVVPAGQVRRIPAELDLRRAVLAEPLAVALHAVGRAGSVTGNRLLVTGAGPIGLLIVAASRHAGAAEITVSDVLAAPLALAARLGATATVRADDPDAAGWPERVDVAFEASGTLAGLSTCLDRIRPGGTVVQLGMVGPGDVGVRDNRMVSREITLRGSFRFNGEFDEALALLAGDLDVNAVVSHRFPLADARSAFDMAADRSIASKVLLDLASWNQ